MKPTKDRFSRQSKTYQKFRPHYPQAIYDHVFSHCHNFDLAWDLGTGNGQVAGVLAERFSCVIANDISAAQLEEAVQKSNITYLHGRAEEITPATGTIDLICIAQAIHWLDIPSLTGQVTRSLKAGGVFAYWGYSLPAALDKMVNSLILYLYTDVLNGYWDEERKLVEKKYTGIEFPMKELDERTLYTDLLWTTEQLGGYLESWSAVQRFIEQNKENPVLRIIKKIEREGVTRVDLRQEFFLKVFANETNRATKDHDLLD